MNQRLVLGDEFVLEKPRGRLNRYEVLPLVLILREATDVRGSHLRQ